MEPSDPKETLPEPSRENAVLETGEPTDFPDFAEDGLEYVSEEYVEDDYGPGETIEGEEIAPSSAQEPTAPRDKILYFGIVASLLLHAGLLFAIPRLVYNSQPQPLIKPGEKVSKVRLLELPPTKKKEPPPKKASAISDRNHIAKRERIPMRPPGSPIGKIMSRPKRMASLPPPVAPENLERPEPEPKPERQPRKKNPSKEPKPKQAQHPKNKSQSKAKPKQAGKSSNVDVDRRMARVDLRPNTQDLRSALSKSTGSGQFFPDGNPEEAVVDMNTREDRYFSYLLHVKKKIEGVWSYPHTAAKAGIGGRLTLEFIIAHNGHLIGVNLLDSSGHNVLDEYAMRAIRAAAPYYPFPPRMKMKRLRVKANFVYVTGRYFKRLM